MKDWKNYDPRSVSDEELLFDHAIVHSWWNNPNLRPAGCTEEDIKRLHEMIVREMERRGMKHDSPLKFAYVHSVRDKPLGESVSLEDVLQYFREPIVISRDFVCLVGGLPNRGSTDGDIDILIRWPENVPEEVVHPIRFRLGRALPPELSRRLQFMLDKYHGPFTSHVPLYDLVLVPTQQHLVMMSRALPGIYLVEPHGRLIWEGKKTVIVKSRKFEKYLNQELYLLEDKRCYGIIRLTAVEGPFTKEQLMTPEWREKHRITDEEWNRWWPDDDEFWVYRFEWVKRFDEPVSVEVPHGTQTFVHEVRLQLRDPVAERQAKQSRDEDAIKPLRFFYPLKATMGYHEGEVFDLEQVLAHFKYPDDYPIACQKKYDGLRIIWMKDGDRVIARTDDGTRCDDRFPTLVKMLKELPVESVVLDSEVEGWTKDGEHWGREITAGYARAHEQPADDRNFVANVFDVLYVDGLPKHHELDVHGDLHKQPYEVRLRVLEYIGALGNWQSTDEIPKVPGFNVVPTHWLKKPDVKELQKLLEKIRNLPGSEGVMLKSGRGDYPLTGHTNTWLKYKKSADIHAVVIERLPTKKEGVYRYRVGLLLPAGWKAPDEDIVELKLKNGKTVKVLNVGKTFNTDKKLNPGDIVTVMFHTLFVYDDGRVRVYEPKLYEVRPEQIIPDTVTDAIRIAEKAGILQHKSMSQPLYLVTCCSTVNPGVINREFVYPWELYASDWHKQVFDRLMMRHFPFAVLSAEYGVWFWDERRPPYKRASTPTVEEWLRALERTVTSIKQRGYDTVVYVSDSVPEWFVERMRNILRTEGIRLVVRSSKELSQKARYALQFHFRGGSVHADLRIEKPDGSALRGWTLAVQEEDQFEREVMKHWKVEKDGSLRKVYWDGELYYVYDMKTDEVLEWNKKLDKQILQWHKDAVFKHPEWWKIDLKTGRPKERPPGEGVDVKRPVVEKIWATRKQDEPKEWLYVEGVYPPREIEPVPGGTRFWPGVFVLVDKGTVEYGAQKSYFQEYFFNGKVLKGRYVFRLVNRNGRMQWLFWKTDDEIPYVISKRAVETGWMPPLGESALPSEWEKRVPKDLRWWEAPNRREAKRRRDEFVKLLQQKELASEPDWKSVRRWLLQYQWWRGPIIIRRGPSRQRYLMRLIGKKVIEIEMENNPLKRHTPAIVRVTGYDEFWDIAPETVIEVPPKTKYNPTKATPSYLMTLDAGKAKVLEADPLVIKIDLGENRTFIMTRARPDETVWEAWIDVGSPTR